MLDGKGFILGNHKDEIFVDVATLHNKVFAVTQNGFLCCFEISNQSNGEQKPIEIKWLSLEKNTFSISLTEKYVACGGADGMIR